MILSKGRRYIFVHIPKTGGTALAQALEARAMADDILVGDTPKASRRRRRVKGIKTAGRLWKHSRLSDLPGLVEEEEMRKLFTFTLVRNPWDRIVSYYHWLKAQTFEHPAVQRARDLEFEGFVYDPATVHSLRAAPYGSYMCLPSGEEHCSAFVRLEHLTADLAPVSTHLGWDIAASIPRLNTSQRARDFRIYYTDQTAQIVADACAADIARFGYSFDFDVRA